MCTSQLDCLCRYHHSDILLRNKAVADGAISFYLDHRVSVRVAKSTYGLECSTKYDPGNLQHQFRSNTIFIQPDGHRSIAKQFDVILGKVRANWHLQLRFWFICFCARGLVCPRRKNFGAHITVSTVMHIAAVLSLMTSRATMGLRKTPNGQTWNPVRMLMAFCSMEVCWLEQICFRDFVLCKPTCHI